MKKIQNILLVALICLGALLVLYLSWVSSPKIGKMRLMPSWMASWVDAYDFMTIRTAIPLVLLGMLAGLYLYYQKKPILWWGSVWGLLSLLVVLAEVGQYFRPWRSFDWKDIAWGSAGAALGLGMMYTATVLLNLIKRKQ